MIKIEDDFFGGDSTLDDLYSFFHYAGSWQFDFFSDKYVWGKKHKDKTESDICKIIRSLANVDPGFTGKGYEVWVNVLDHNNNYLHHHVDCDEEVEGIEPAKKTAVLFLGGDEIEGGELVMDPEPYQPGYFFEEDIYNLAERSKANKWLKIEYKPSRLVIFEGNHAHGVLPIRHMQSGSSRISLMISCWDKKIKVQR
jgi:hypothetical protein